MLSNWSRLKLLNHIWWFLLVAYLAVAVVLITVCALWAEQDSTKLDQHILRRLTITRGFLNIGLVVAAFVVASALVGAIGFFTGITRTLHPRPMGLVAFSWAVVLTAIVTTVGGSIIWFYTLTERADFEQIWTEEGPATQAFLQDTLYCCGYWNATSAGLFAAPTGFCARSPPPGTACVGPITKFADFLLNRVFSTIYGFTVIEVSLFLATCCLIISRREECRWIRIEQKTGRKGGFI